MQTGTTTRGVETPHGSRQNLIVLLTTTPREVQVNSEVILIALHYSVGLCVLPHGVSGGTRPVCFTSRASDLEISRALRPGKFPIHTSYATCKPGVNCFIPYMWTRPVTRMGHYAGRRVFWEGPKFFKLCPTFFQEGEKCCRGESPPAPYSCGPAESLSSSSWFLVGA